MYGAATIAIGGAGLEDINGCHAPVRLPTAFRHGGAALSHRHDPSLAECLMRLLCDEMLVGLARWLRAAGHDAATPVPGDRDRRLIARAAVEERLFLTRDRPIALHRAAAGLVVILDAESLDAQAHELRRRLALDWLAAPFTRCLVCNVALDRAGREGMARAPAAAREGQGPFCRCPSCERLYWPGSHARRMRARLEGWAKGGGP